MTLLEGGLLPRCHFPPPGSAADLAVSGGPDSTGLLVLALAAGLVVTVHHVDHHARPDSERDAALVAAAGERLGVRVVVHDALVEPGANFEARARAARRGALPAGALTGHTMDDLAETVLLNLLRGAGVDGLGPMGSTTTPLRDLRRDEVRAVAAASGLELVHDPMNDDAAFARNRVRHEVIPLLNDVARRDVVPVIARGAALADADRRWLDALADDGPSLADADCRDLAAWPDARLRRWLRARMTSADGGDGAHPPSAAEVERAIGVVRGEVAATELAGGRRLARTRQRLTLT